MSVEMGRRFPLHAGSSGKSILAFLPTAELERILADPLPALTPRTVTDSTALRAELERIRKLGYAVSVGERQPDAGSVAAPVFGFDDMVVGAISVCGPRFRVDESFVLNVAPHLVAAASSVSRSLGSTHP